jgi:hypothetical protein
MFARLTRRRPSASLLISMLALFVALGGTTYAVTVPRNSIGPAQLRSASVTTSKLAAKSVIRTKLGGGVVGTDQIGTQVVTAAKIADGAVGNGQLASSSVSGSKLASSSVSNGKLGSGSVSNSKLGTNSVSTSKIQGGAVGASKLDKIVVREASVTVPANPAGNGEYFTRLAQANCASTERAIGLGTRWTVDNNDEELVTVSLRFATDAAGNPNGAIARGGSDLNVDRVFAVQVSCLQE